MATAGIRPDPRPPAGSSDPMAEFTELYARAADDAPFDVAAVALATADDAGRPSVRVVLLRGLLTADEVETLRLGVERNLADLSPLGMNATKPGEPGAFVEDFRNWQRIPEYEQVFRSSALAVAGGALMRARSVRLFHDHLLVKETGTRDRSPWHQDQPYY